MVVVYPGSTGFAGEEQRQQHCLVNTHYIQVLTSMPLLIGCCILGFLFICGCLFLLKSYSVKNVTPQAIRKSVSAVLHAHSP